MSWSTIGAQLAVKGKIGQGGSGRSEDEPREESFDPSTGGEARRTMSMWLGGGDLLQRADREGDLMPRGAMSSNL